MKRMMIALLSMLILCGCTQYDSIDLQGRLQEQIDAAQSWQVSEATNSKPFYSYYLPRDIGRFESTASGNLFCIDGVRVAMSLNTAAIINTILYPSKTEKTVELNGQARVAYMESEYTDINGDAHAFQAEIFDLGNTYAVGFVSDTVLLQATCRALQTGVIAGRMLQIARSLTVNTDQIVTYYSNQVPEINNQEKVELFDTQAPENGRIEELFEDHTRIDSIPSVDNQTQSTEKSSD